MLKNIFPYILLFSLVTPADAGKNRAAPAHQGRGASQASARYAGEALEQAQILHAKACREFQANRFKEARATTQQTKALLERWLKPDDKSQAQAELQSLLLHVTQFLEQALIFKSADLVHMRRVVQQKHDAIKDATALTEENKAAYNGMLKSIALYSQRLICSSPAEDATASALFNNLHAIADILNLFEVVQSHPLRALADEQDVAKLAELNVVVHVFELYQHRLLIARLLQNEKEEGILPFPERLTRTADAPHQIVIEVRSFREKLTRYQSLPQFAQQYAERATLDVYICLEGLITFGSREDIPSIHELFNHLIILQQQKDPLFCELATMYLEGSIPGVALLSNTFIQDLLRYANSVIQYSYVSADKQNAEQYAAVFKLAYLLQTQMLDEKTSAITLINFSKRSMEQQEKKPHVAQSNIYQHYKAFLIVHLLKRIKSEPEQNETVLRAQLELMFMLQRLDKHTKDLPDSLAFTIEHLGIVKCALASLLFQKDSNNEEASRLLKEAIKLRIPAVLHQVIAVLSPLKDNHRSLLFEALTRLSRRTRTPDEQVLYKELRPLPPRIDENSLPHAAPTLDEQRLAIEPYLNLFYGMGVPQNIVAALKGLESLGRDNLFAAQALAAFYMQPGILARQEVLLFSRPVQTFVVDATHTFVMPACVLQPTYFIDVNAQAYNREIFFQLVLAASTVSSYEEQEALRMNIHHDPQAYTAMLRQEALYWYRRVTNLVPPNSPSPLLRDLRIDAIAFLKGSAMQ